MGYKVYWKNRSNGDYAEWSLNEQGALADSFVFNEAQLSRIESAHDFDINGDGNIDQQVSPLAPLSLLVKDLNGNKVDSASCEQRSFSLGEFTAAAPLRKDSRSILDSHKVIDFFSATSKKASADTTSGLDFTIKIGTVKSVVAEIELNREFKANAYVSVNPNTGEAFDFTYDPITGLGAQLLDNNKNGLVDTLKIHLQDGARGDVDALINGEIRVPGVLADIDYVGGATNYSYSLSRLSGSTSPNSLIGAFENYQFYNLGGNRQGIQKKGTGAIDEITGIATLTFNDTRISISDSIIGVFNQVTGKETKDAQMFRLYNASFNRFPDSDGLKYWINEYSKGISGYKNIAESFIISNEFKQRYGATNTNLEFATNMYKNILGRLPDAEGLNYWVSNLNAGTNSRVDVLGGFSESIENKNLFSQVTGFV